MMHENRFKGSRVRVRNVNPAELTQQQKARIADRANRHALERESAARLVAAAKGRIDDERLGWAIARVPVGQERIACDELQAAGIAFWCPLASGKRPPKRGRPAVTFERPVFTGYVFVRLPWCAEAWVGAMIAARISAWLGIEGVPARITTERIKRLMLDVKSPDVATLTPKLKPGMKARIEDGPFRHFEATVKRVMGGKGMAKVEVSLFGNVVPVELGLDQLKV
ncbi:transcription termination/antitermination protein NusG [Hoeflea sp.]|uniref:transcription termination/antitermination protein NusG n=1 Tax=Hoeflea sp. TaxID=1940281 RepID=UPI003B518F13